MSDSIIDVVVNDMDYDYKEETNWERGVRKIKDLIRAKEQEFLSKKLELNDDFYDNYKEQKELQDQADEEHYKKTHNDLEL